MFSVCSVLNDVFFLPNTWFPFVFCIQIFRSEDEFLILPGIPRISFTYRLRRKHHAGVAMK